MNVFTILLNFSEKFLYANSVDQDQMPHSAASDLGLHCLHISPKQVFQLRKG